MARVRAPTQQELAAFIVAHGITDFISGGKLSLLERNALWKVVKKLGPPAAQAARRAPMRLAGTAAQVALKHPALVGAGLVYVAYTNREQIADLVRQGYDIVEPQVEAFRERADPVLSRAAEMTAPVYPSGPGISALPFIQPRVEKFLRKRKKSKFNIAVAAGMRAVKGSTSYGKKGVIKPAKKAFALVTKLASAKKKKKKAPKSGIRRKIWNAMKGLR